MSVTEADVVAAYRAILRREPESGTAIRAHMNASSLEELLQRFVSSPEFATGPLSVPRALDLPPMHVEVDASRDTLARMHDHIRTVWNRLGHEEPHWSVLTNPAFRSDVFPENRRKFYDTGREFVEELDASLKRCGLSLDSYPKCFELGCGVGRLTASLAARFTHLIAADVSPNHLEIAKAELSSRNFQHVVFICLEQPSSLTEIPPFDIFVSLIVLQHNPPPIISYMLRTLLNTLSSGGIGYFQVPTYLQGYHFNINRYMSSIEDCGIEMHVLPQKNVFDIIHECGCKVIEVREDNATGIASGISNRFLVIKQL